MNHVTMAAGSDGDEVQLAVTMSPSLYDSSKPSILGFSFGKAAEKTSITSEQQALYYTLLRLNIIKRFHSPTHNLATKLTGNCNIVSFSSKPKSGRFAGHFAPISTVTVMPREFG